MLPATSLVHRIVLIYGLPAAGKTTVSLELSAQLTRAGLSVLRLDGEELRHSVSRDLGYAKRDRLEQARRLGRLASAGLARFDVAVCAAIVPYEEGRKLFLAETATNSKPLLVYLSTPLRVCEARDPKGLYALARSNSLLNFTGVSDPFEAPSSVDFAIDTTTMPCSDAASAILARMVRHHENS